MSWISKAVKSIQNKKEKVFIIIIVLLLISKFKKIFFKWKGYSTQQLDVYKMLRQDQFIKYTRLAEQKIPPEKQQFILGLSASELAESIKANRVTCEEALLSYIQRVSSVGAQLQVIADINFEEALLDAQEKDKQLINLRQNSFSTTGNQPLPPLFGVPVSSKEQLKVKGLITTAGYQSKFKPDKSTIDSELMAILRRNGAIPFINSNVPQGLFGLESHNQVWGQAKNPWNQLCTPGGSSGGECGVIAAQCSPLGICSDSLGSIRIPASFCGIRAFKPSGQRISKKGRVGISGQEGESFKIVETSIGPVAKSVEDLILVMRLVFGNQINDVTIPNKQPWSQTQFESVPNLKNIKIGYFTTTAKLPVTPPIHNVMKEVVDTLQQQGSTIIEFKFQEFDELQQITIKLFSYLGVYEVMQRNLLGEQALPYQNVHIFFVNELYYYQKKLLTFYYRKTGQIRLAEILENQIKPSQQEFNALIKRKEMIMQNFREQWQREQIDALICPVFFSTAPVHGSTPYLINYLTFCCFQSAFDLPSGVIPIRTVRKEETIFEATRKDVLTEMMSLNAHVSEGLPVSIQITTRQFEDEKCLNIMQQIDNLFKFRQLPNIETSSRKTEKDASGGESSENHK